MLLSNLINYYFAVIIKLAVIWGLLQVAAEAQMVFMASANPESTKIPGKRVAVLLLRCNAEDPDEEKNWF